MAIDNTKELDLKDIQRKFNISQKRIDILPVDKLELNKIYHDFQHSLTTLEGAKADILNELNEKLMGRVHSIRCRIKDKDHVIEKIIRNFYDKPEKYGAINSDNYNKIITDLIGVRIVILDKRDWREIHNSLLQIFRNIPERYAINSDDIITYYDKYEKESNSADNHSKDSKFENSYHAEKPKVYITSEDDRSLYQDDNLDIDNSKTHYRSIHYIIRYKLFYFEIQVRSLFEEGWLEFDHRIKYPYDQNNHKKGEYASILSNLAIAADRLISFYDPKNFEQECIDKADENIDVPETLVDINEATEQDLQGKMIQLF